MPKKGYKASLWRLMSMITSLKNGSSQRRIRHKKGIHSFSAYVTYQLSQLMNEDKKHYDKNKTP